MSAADDLTEARNSLVEARHNLDVLWEMARQKYDGHPDSLDEAVFLVARELASAHISVTALLEAELHEPDEPEGGTITRLERISRNGGRADG